MNLQQIKATFTLGIAPVAIPAHSLVGIDATGVVYASATVKPLGVTSFDTPAGGTVQIGTGVCYIRKALADTFALGAKAYVGADGVAAAADGSAGIAGIVVGASVANSTIVPVFFDFEPVDNIA